MAVSIRSAKLPILTQLLDYRRHWLKLDFAAGLSVAAVSLPSAIAYPAIAGLPTEMGFFATILALVAYAVVLPVHTLFLRRDGKCGQQRDENDSNCFFHFFNSPRTLNQKLLAFFFKTKGGHGRA